jgi:hypothetical protein
LDLGKSPICIHSKECCYLQFYSKWHSSDIITVFAKGGGTCSVYMEKNDNLLRPLTDLQPRKNAGQQMRMTYQLGNNKSTHKQEAGSVNK